jgi:hypothetical protein
MSVSTCGCEGISHGYPNFIWQGVTPIILGWFPGYTWKIKTRDVPRDLNYFVIFYHVYILYKCGSGWHDTTWRVTGVENHDVCVRACMRVGFFIE